MPAPEPVSSLHVATDNQLQILRDEFKALQKQQWDALEHATFMGMSANAALLYEHRARRINELQRALCVNWIRQRPGERRSPLAKSVSKEF